MSITASLLFLCVGLSSAKKQGDFGLFTACTTKNSSLSLSCIYAPCRGSPPFDCEIKTSSLDVLLEASDDKCQYPIPGHRQLYGNVTTTYTCTLTRRGRTEERTISIDYSIRKGKRAIKPCRGSAGAPLLQRPRSPWPLEILPLWMVFVTVR